MEELLGLKDTEAVTITKSNTHLIITVSKGDLTCNTKIELNLVSDGVIGTVLHVLLEELRYAS